MKTILSQLQELADADLYALSEAVDMELDHRDEIVGEAPDSGRRRAAEREEGYRRRNGAAVPRDRIISIGKSSPRRRAA